MKTDRAVTILLQAEKSLAEIASEAVKAGEYERAKIILGMTARLSSMTREIAGEASVQADVVPVATVITSNESSSLRNGRKKGKRSAYPKFYRDGDGLLKVGYSKRAGEYEHKAPSTVLFALAEAVAKAGEKGRRFTMEDLTPLVSASLGNTVPVYQPYVCLSWLRELGVVAQHGRKGYSVKTPSQIPLQVRSHWENLTVRANDLN